MFRLAVCTAILVVGVESRSNLRPWASHRQNHPFAAKHQSIDAKPQILELPPAHAPTVAAASAAAPLRSRSVLANTRVSKQPNVVKELQQQLAEVKLYRSNVDAVKQTLEADVSLLRESTQLVKSAEDAEARAEAEQQLRQAKTLVKETEGMVLKSRAEAEDRAHQALKEAAEVQSAVDALVAEARQQVKTRDAAAHSHPAAQLVVTPEKHAVYEVKKDAPRVRAPKRQTHSAVPSVGHSVAYAKSNLKVGPKVARGKPQKAAAAAHVLPKKVVAARAKPLKPAVASPVVPKKAMLPLSSVASPVVPLSSVASPVAPSSHDESSKAIKTVRAAQPVSHDPPSDDAEAVDEAEKIAESVGAQSETPKEPTVETDDDAE